LLEECKEYLIVINFKTASVMPTLPVPEHCSISEAKRCNKLVRHTHMLRPALDSENLNYARLCGHICNNLSSCYTLVGSSSTAKAYTLNTLWLSLYNSCRNEDTNCFRISKHTVSVVTCNTNYKQR